MNKTITIKTDHEYESRGKKITVADALDWVEKHIGTVDEEGNEGPKYTPGDLICYAVNRLKALHKDHKRYKKGVLAERLYAPRIDNVEHKPRKLAPLVEEIHSVAPAKPKAEKVKKPRTKKPKAPRRPAVEQGNATVAEAL